MVVGPNAPGAIEVHPRHGEAAFGISHSKSLMAALAVVGDHRPGVDLESDMRRGEILDNQAGRDRINSLQVLCDHWIDLFPIGPIGGEVIDQTDIFDSGAGFLEQSPHIVHGLVRLGCGIVFTDKFLAVERQASTANQKDLVASDHRLAGLKVRARGEEVAPGISCPNPLVRHRDHSFRLYDS